MKKYLLSFISFICFSGATAQSFPDNQLLNDLQQYSQQTIECSEFACNSINAVSFDVKEQQIVASFNVSSRKNSFITLPLREEEMNITSILLDNKPWHQIVFKDSTYKVVVPEGEHTITVLIKSHNGMISLTQKIPNISVSSSLSLDQRNGSSLIAIKQAHTQQTSLNNNSDKSIYPTEAFYQVSRHLALNNSWKVTTTITPLFDTNKNTVLNIALLKGEKILNSDIKIENNNAIVSVSNQPLSWESSLAQVNSLEVPAINEQHYQQVFSVDSSHIWQYSVKGKNPFNISGDTTSWALWNGEKLHFDFKAPKVLEGKTLSFSNLHIQFNKSHDTSSYQYTLNAHTSLAGKTFFTIPDNYIIESLIVNQQAVNINKNTKKIPVDLAFGNNIIAFSISTDKEQFIFKTFPHVQFPEKVYNAFYSLSSPDWLIYSGGADINTEYIIFSSLVFLIIVTFITKKITPSLNMFVIGFILFGFLQNSILIMLLLPILLGLVKLKQFIVQRFAKNKNDHQYNLYQFILIFTSFVFLVSFLITLKLGLLDSPSSWILHDNYRNNIDISWFNEIYSSNPIWYLEIDSTVYHLIMFAWAIFVSYHLINIAKLLFKSIFSFELWIKKQELKPVIIEDGDALSSNQITDNNIDDNSKK